MKRVLPPTGKTGRRESAAAFGFVISGILICAYSMASQGASETSRLLIDEDAIRRSEEYADFYSFRDGKVPEAVQVRTGSTSPGQDALIVTPENEVVEIVIPARGIENEPCVAEIQMSSEEGALVKYAWLDASGEVLGGNPAASELHPGGRRHFVLDTEIGGGTAEGVSALRIRFEGVPESFELDWVSLVRKAGRRGVWKRLSQRSLLAARVTAGRRIDWSLRVPPRATLLLSTAFEPKRSLRFHGDLRFSITATTEGKPPLEIFLEVKSTETRAENATWTDHRIDLGDFSGKDVTLTFRAYAASREGERSASPEDEIGSFLWGDPVIFVTDKSARPNVVLIGIDTFRQDKVGAYGNDRNLTPNIDRLARDGLLFERALSTSSWTLPAFASLYTSLYPSTHGAGTLTDLDPRGTSSVPPPTGLSDSVLTLAEILSENGYASGCFHNNHFLSGEFNMDQGFDVERRDPSGATSVDYALAFLRDHLSEPTFVVLHFMEPHAEYEPPQRFRDKVLPEKLQDGEEGRRLKREYLYEGEVAFTDELVGNFLAGLDRLGLIENTLVILTSDHGEEFYEHYDFSKRHYRDKVSQKFGIGHGYSLFREIVDVPLIMRFPGRIEPGTKASRRVSIIDIAPTVLDWLGIEAPLQFGGRSLRRSDEPGRDFDFAESFTRGGLLRQAYYRENWKIIAELRSRFVELYDLDRDPWEQTNLAEKEAERAGSMLKALTEVLARSERLREELDLGEPPLPLLPEETARDLEALGYID